MTAEAAGSPTRTTTFPFDQVVVIFNPHSTGSAPELAEQLRTDLERRLPRTPVHLSPTEHAGHARDLARNAAPTPRTLIVSVSGDGGYNEVVDGVMQAGDTGTVCAVMAAGNANDHRRTTGTVFRRGEKPIQLVYNGPAKEEPSRANPTMWPISDRGPFYAALVTGGTLDTKGGPRTNPDGQVLDDTGAPVPGLYGVGNRVASASAQGYWAGGATLGPIIPFAHRAAQAANREPGTVQLTPA
jgi:hypothetical protein